MFIAQAFFDLENTNQELKSDLKDLYINQAVYVVISPGCKDFKFGFKTEISLFFSVQSLGYFRQP